MMVWNWKYYWFEIAEKRSWITILVGMIETKVILWELEKHQCISDDGSNVWFGFPWVSGFVNHLPTYQKSFSFFWFLERFIGSSIHPSEWFENTHVNDELEIAWFSALLSFRRSLVFAFSVKMCVWRVRCEGVSFMTHHWWLTVIRDCKDDSSVCRCSAVLSMSLRELPNYRHQ